MTSAAGSSSSILLKAEDGENAWILIELQGTIESRNGLSLDGVEFARLNREVCCVHVQSFSVVSTDRIVLHSQGGVPKLIMGKMQLEGTEVKLKKPLAIMTLIKPDDGSTQYHTAGVVRQKLVFKTRPVPASRPPLPEPSTQCGSKRARVDGANPSPPAKK